MWKPLNKENPVTQNNQCMNQADAQSLLNQFKYRSVIDLVFRDDSNNSVDSEELLYGKLIKLNSKIEQDKDGALKIVSNDDDQLSWEDEDSQYADQLENEIYDQMYEDIQQDIDSNIHNNNTTKVKFNQIHAPNDEEWITDEDEFEDDN